MKPGKLTITALLCFSFLSCFSQEFEVPEKVRLDKAEDYAQYEKDIIAAAKWLVATPLNEQEDKRKEVSGFAVVWINGSPTVNVEINPTIMDFDDRNKGMLVIYMASSARFVLENNYSKDMRAKHKAALRDMMAVYKSGAGIKKDKKMDKLIKADEDGKLDDWLAENLKVNY